MPSQEKLFLSSSIDSSNALTELFDFVWPTSAALWNFKWQASGFLAAFPTATDEELRGKFVVGSGIRGVNVKRAAIEKSWEEMQQWFSRLLLSEACSLFEGWIESALDELVVPRGIRGSGSKSLDKKLQFPSVLDATGKVSGESAYAVEKIVGSMPSQTMVMCFEPTLLKNKKNSGLKIENLLICYRVFKEIRNDFVHHGGRASAKTDECYDAYFKETAATLGLKEKPELAKPMKGKVIELSLRGVVGFSDVVLRLIATYDQLLTRSSLSEGILKRRWLDVHKGKVTVKPAGPARDGQVASLIKQCELPLPTALQNLYSHLSAQGLAV